MSFTYGFYNSIGGDRKYTAEQMSAIFDGIIKDGVFSSIGNALAVTEGSGMQVIVGTGKAWFNHTWSINDAPMPLSIGDSDITLKRYDTVVLEINASQNARKNEIKIVTGTPASNPTKPVLTNTEDVHQYPLAYIYVGAGVKTISKSAIENAVGKGDCPFVTGILEAVDITDLFTKWEGDFEAWFENVKSQLEGDVATNLQRQIDALKAEAARVGDIWLTTKSTLGDKWALCNGMSFDTSEYSDLANSLKTNVKLAGPYNITSVDPNMSKIVNLNGHAFLFGKSVNYIYVSENFTKPWVKVTFSEIEHVTTVAYKNGKYIVSGNIQASGFPVNEAHLYHSTSPTTGYTHVKMVDSLGNIMDTCNDVAYFKRYWVFGGDDNDASHEQLHESVIYYTNNFVSFTRFKISTRDSSRSHTVNKLRVTPNGTYLVALWSYVDSDYDWVYGISFLDALRHIYGWSADGSLHDYYYSDKTKLYVTNTYAYIVCYYKGFTSTPAGYVVKRATIDDAINFSFTEMYFGGGNSKAPSQMIEMQIADDGTAYLLDGTYRTLYKLSNGSQSKVSDMAIDDVIPGNSGLYYQNNVIAFHYDPDTTASYAYDLIGTFYNAIPNVSISGARAFIKVKE